MEIDKFKSGIAFAAALGIGAAAPVYAAGDTAAGLPFGLEFSAFGDVQSSYDDTGRQKLDFGSLELDVSAEFSDDLQGALALVTDQTSTAVAVAFLDYHTFGGRIAPRGRLWVEKGFHLHIGQFDVPFGSDWQFFASTDSISISRPLTTDLVMEGGYNDTGIRVLGNNGSINFNTFLLHGFNSGRLVGGRLGLTPFSDPFSLKGAQEPKTFEFGLSYLLDTDSSWKKNEVAWAVDAEASRDAWTGRFEYMVRRKELLIDPARTVTRAWHITQEYALDEEVFWPTTLFARYDQGTVQPAEILTPGASAGDDHDARIAAGFKTNPGGSENVHWKFEVQHYRAATPSTREMPGFGRRLFWYTQLVLSI
ncbi:MAG: hypothetical protein PHH36_06740 [Sideroxydans sp.]|nr:hypothetical protein [Sideroxydans sp.]